MRDYGKVYTAFWHDPDMRGISDDGRMLALYLMTTPHGNMLGCFRLTDAYAADDMKWDTERVRKGFAELFQCGFAYRCDSTFWVLIRQYLKWNQFENPNVATAASKLFDSLPCPDLVKTLLSGALREFSERFAVKVIGKFEPITEPFANPFELSAKTRARTRATTSTRTAATTGAGAIIVERRGAPPDRDLVPRIFQFWQETMESPRSKLDAKRINLIRKALELGYSPRDLCEAIRGCAMSPFHMGQNDRSTKYNGLDLIFRSADKIDAFIVLSKGGATAGGEETMEQRNARITAELLGPEDDKTDDDIIDMEPT